jgi:hypothetical protein
MLAAVDSVSVRMDSSRSQALRVARMTGVSGALSRSTQTGLSASAGGAVVDNPVAHRRVLRRRQRPLLMRDRRHAARRERLVRTTAAAARDEHERRGESRLGHGEGSHQSAVDLVARNVVKLRD